MALHIALPTGEEFYILSELLCHLSGTTTLRSLAQDTAECRELAMGEQALPGRPLGGTRSSWAAPRVSLQQKSGFCLPA